MEATEEISTISGHDSKLPKIPTELRDVVSPANRLNQRGHTIVGVIEGACALSKIWRDSILRFLC